ncbi:MAG: hypothetical protein J6Z14_11150 [Prevotella sp.]|nr:hypothetical protein [Prevotella sp.]
MTDYKYIMAQCRKYHFTGWDEKDLRECQEILPNLTRQELVSVYRSRLLGERHPLKQTAFKVLFADKIVGREERIRKLETDALIEEFKDKKSGNVALIRKEMRERYRANKGFDRSKIATAFNASIKSDQQWVKSQIRKERYGDSNKNQWQKPGRRQY